MYEKFFGISEKPFNITPDPRFLYLSKYHQEALAHLIYGVSERKGFIVLTGEVGAGKTTLIHTLLEKLDPSVKTAYIFNPNLTLKELFVSILEEFELNAKSRTKADFLIELNNFLIERLKNNEGALLIIDEAQNLTPSILEEVRLLLNLETSKEKLLQIILAGQPELNHKLDLHQLRQLRQRISIRYHLLPLTKIETKEYINQRLKIAGANNSSVFTEKAIEEIFKYTQGIPRLINILCDNSMLTGYATDQRKIGPKIIKESIEDLGLQRAHNKHKKVINADSPTLSRNLFKKRVWRLSFILVILSFFFAGNLWLEPSFLENLKNAFDPLLTKTEETQTLLAHQVKAIPPKRSHVNKIDSSQSIIPDQGAVIMNETESQYVPMTREMQGRENLTSGQVVTVGKNDNLSKIALKKYGKVSQYILSSIQRANPEIIDINYIEVGQMVILPELSKDTDLQEVHNDLFSVHVASFQSFIDAHTLFSQLVAEGFEAYLIPVHIFQKGQWYRICLGKFKGKHEASTYANGLLASGKFDYALPLYVQKTEAGEIER